MRTKLRWVLLAIFCASAYTACQRASEQKMAEERRLKVDSLANEYKAHSDSMSIAWNKMMMDEEQKLARIERILQEISHRPVFNKPRYDSLYEDLKKLSELQYKPETMTDEEITAYDSSIDRLILEVKAFASDHPDVEEYPLTDSLIGEVEQAHQRVLFHRSLYDNYAKDFNRWLDSNQDYLYDLDTAGNYTLERRPLFELPSE